MCSSVKLTTLATTTVGTRLLRYLVLVLASWLLPACGDGIIIACNKDVEKNSALTFTSTNIRLAADSHPVGMVTGDFNDNAEHFLDIAIATEGIRRVSLLLNEGKGRFSLKEQFVDTTTSSAIVSGDFDGDKKADLALTDATQLHVLLGDGTGNFADKQQIQTAETLIGAVAGDGNLDGAPDIYAYSQHGISEFLSQKSKENPFVAPRILADESPSAMAFHALEGEEKTSLIFTAHRGQIDIIHLTEKGIAAASRESASLEYPRDCEIQNVLPLQKDFPFLKKGSFGFALGLNSLGVGVAWPIFNHDQILFYQGDTWNYADKTLRSLGMADLNNDQRTDIVAAMCTKQDPTTCRLLFLLATIDGRFQCWPSSDYSLDEFQYPRSIVVGDFNKDGLNDWAVADYITGVVKIGLQTK